MITASRERREDARKLVAAGIDPAAQRKAERAGIANTFEAIALEWLAKEKFAATTLDKADWTFKELIFPPLGSRRSPASRRPKYSQCCSASLL